MNSAARTSSKWTATVGGWYNGGLDWGLGKSAGSQTVPRNKSVSSPPANSVSLPKEKGNHFGHIALRGVRVHNLKSIDLDIPRRQLVVLCGLSGSGKSSLAIDTLYAEGQRRYIESFSAYTRQFLQRLEKPDADRIDGLPPAIAVTGRNAGRSSRSTIGTTTETNDYLRLLFAKIGRVFCRQCGREVRCDTPQSAAETLAVLPPGSRYMIAFACPLPEGGSIEQLAAGLREDGFVRAVIDGRLVNLDEGREERGEGRGKAAASGQWSVASGEGTVLSGQWSGASGQRTDGEAATALPSCDGKSEDGCVDATSPIPNPQSLIPNPSSPPLYVIVDRLTAGGAAENRLRDSLETAFVKGQGRCYALVEEGSGARDQGSRAGNSGQWSVVSGQNRQIRKQQSPVSSLPSPVSNPPSPAPNPSPLPLPSPLSPLSSWRRIGFSAQLACEDCGLEYPTPEPRLYSFNSPLGACPQCEGFGNVIDLDMDLIVPDAGKSIREGAIALWNSPAYAHELKELLALARDYGLPVDVPFRQLTEPQRDIIFHGVPERNFGGLDGFFAWLERRKYKMHIRVFLSRWRSYRLCPACGGTRLRPEALATQIGGKNIGEICTMKVRDAAEFFRNLKLSDHQRRVGRTMLEQVQARLGYLEAVGLGYLTLDRTLRTLSGGESRRVALDLSPRVESGQHALRARRAFDRPASPRHPAASRRDQKTPRPRQFRRGRRA